MSWFITMLLATAGVLIAEWVRKEADDWTPKLVARLVGWIVKRLPEARQTRLEEEWLACLRDLPTPISQTIFAMNIWIAAERIRWRDGGTVRARLGMVARATGGGVVLPLSSVHFGPTRRARAIGWFVLGVVVAPGCYLVNSQGAAAQLKVKELDRDIAKAKRDIELLDARLAANLSSGRGAVRGY